MNTITSRALRVSRCLVLLSVVMAGMATGCRRERPWSPPSPGDELALDLGDIGRSLRWYKCYYGMPEADVLHILGPPTERSDDLLPFRHFRAPQSGQALLWRDEDAALYALIDTNEDKLVDLLVAWPERRTARSVLGNRAEVFGSDLEPGIAEDELVAILGPPDRIGTWPEGVQPELPGARVLAYDGLRGYCVYLFFLDPETRQLLRPVFQCAVIF